MNALLTLPTIDERPVALSSGALAKKAEVLKLSKTVTETNNAQQLQENVNNDKAIKELMKAAENMADVLKEPFYRTYKNILAKRDEFILELENEAKRLKGLRDGYMQREADRVQEENERLAEERQAAENKLQAELDEQTRLASLKKPQVQKEIAVESRIEKAAETLQQIQTTAPAVVTRAAGLKIRHVVKFEITDKAALYALRPEWFDLNEKKSVINASITKDTKIPGLKVWESIET